LEHLIAKAPEAAPLGTGLPDPAPQEATDRNKGSTVVELKTAQHPSTRRADQQAALYKFTDRLYRAHSADEVHAAALDAIIEALACQRASILLFDGAGTMRFVASRGLSPDYCAAVEGHSPWKQGDLEPKPITINDMAKSDQPDELKAVVAKEGISGLAFVPVTSEGGVSGKFMAYYDQPHAFTQEEEDIALTISRQLGFAIARLGAEQAVKESERRLNAMFDSAGVGMVLLDQNCVIQRSNRMFSGIYGEPSEALVGRTCMSLTHPDDIPKAVAAVEQLNRTGEPVAFEKRYVRNGKISNHVRVTLSLVTPQQILAVVEDVTARIEARMAFSEIEAFNRRILDSSHDGIKVLSLDGVIESINARGAGLLELETVDDVLGTSWADHWGGVTHEQAVEALAAARAGGVGRVQGFRATAKGAPKWWDVVVTPIVGEDGKPHKLLSISRDVTEAKQAEERRTLLINELNHRVKNTLATVQSLAMQTLRGAERPADAREVFEARLSALSRAHDVLVVQSWEGAGLRDVVSRALEPFRTDRDSFVLEGPNVRLSPKQVLALSLALHELATNAVKYGALSGEAGQVAIGWSIEPGAEGAEIELTWTESGGPPVAEPGRTGFGTRLIQRSLTHDLGSEASIDFRPEGVVAVLRTPVEAVSLWSRG
jgi:PAS domain S-box-containing protein